MDELCKRLDGLAEEYFHVLSEVFKEYKELESHMKDGYLCMSHARKSMGVHRLGASQYNYDVMNASAGVLVDNADGLLSFQKCDPSSTSDAKEESKDGIKKSKDSIRRRGAPSSDDGNISQLANSVENINIKNEKETPNEVKRKDPITMFGVLVPQTLRRSQDRFSRAVDLTISIASLKLKLTHIKKQYKELAKNKTELLKKYDAEDDIIEDLPQ